MAPYECETNRVFIVTHLFTILYIGVEQSVNFPYVLIFIRSKYYFKSHFIDMVFPKRSKNSHNLMRLIDDINQAQRKYTYGRRSNGATFVYSIVLFRIFAKTS